ncbi:MAG: diguanylate cyclase [Spirochaetia bacterium]
MVYNKKHMDFVSINIVSIPSLIGAVVLLVFLLFSLTYFAVIHRQKLLLFYAGLQFGLFLFVGGYGMYTTLSDPLLINLMTRICFTGAAITPLFFYLFISEIIRNKRSWLFYITLVFAILSVIGVWASSSLIITNAVQFQPHKGYFTMVKGHLFPVFFAINLVLILSIYAWFTQFYFSNMKQNRVYLPLLISFSVWIIASIHDGLVSLHLFDHPALPWIGPVLMIWMIGSFIARLVNAQERRLQETTKAKLVLEERINRDSLTGLFNRDYLEEILNHEITKKTRHAVEHALIFMDIDNFKEINDNYGHGTGDEVLQCLAEILRLYSRETDLPARFAGDEFAVLFLDCPRDQAIRLSTDIKNTFHRLLHERFSFSQTIKTGLSIGVLPSAKWSSSVVDTMKKVDKRMYRAKSSGKDQVYG